MPGRARRRVLPFLLWLAGFYTVWLCLVAGGGYGPMLLEHWQIAVAMLFGSFVAGSTPMGGGTVGFPVLVMLLGELPSMGRDFSFCIQSIGMTSASIWIVCQRIPVDWKILRPALVGVLIGTPAGLAWFAPLVSGSVVKVAFALFWGCFAAVSLLRYRDFVSPGKHTELSAPADLVGGLLCGLAGGITIASITGVGTDMLIFMFLVLVKRTDIRVAIPTSVILMAATSLVGVACQTLAGRLDAGVFPFWLAAAPIVILGAPLGSIAVEYIGRMRMLLFVVLLCVAQLVWTLSIESGKLDAGEWGWVAAGTLALAICLALLDGLGQRLRTLGAARE
jgi:uncharacterized membrane protein YfcA